MLFERHAKEVRGPSEQQQQWRDSSIPRALHRIDSGWSLCESGMVSSSLSLESSLLQCLRGHAHQGTQVTDQSEDTTQDSVVPQKPTTDALVCAAYQCLWCKFSQHGN